MLRRKGQKRYWTDLSLLGQEPTFKGKNKKKIYFFSVNTKNFSSHVLKISAISLVKLLIFSTHSMKYIWYSPQKSKYPLYIF